VRTQLRSSHRAHRCIADLNPSLGGSTPAVHSSVGIPPPLLVLVLSSTWRERVAKKEILNPPFGHALSFGWLQDSSPPSRPAKV